MFRSKTHCNYARLKSNLRLCGIRLQNLQKKKTELNVRARRDLADYLKQNKVDRARIRVQQIVRDDYMIEVYDILETFCDLLISRMGLIESADVIDPGLMDAIATMLWVAPRLFSELPELKIITKEFASKYGKQFVEACSSTSSTDVNPKVKQKMSVKAPPDNLCEAYLVEIARSYDVEFTPDANLLNNNLAPLVDIGPPPPLPTIDIFSKDFDNSGINFGQAPYPTNQFFQPPNLPFFLDEKSDPSSGFIGGTSAPPPYGPPYGSSSIEKDEKPELHVDPPVNFSESPPGSDSGPPSPPATDDQDLADLTARFNKLKNG